jgi:hypothetical protein
MKLVSFTFWPLYPVIIKWKAGWAPTVVWILSREKIRATTRIRSRTIHRHINNATRLQLIIIAKGILFCTLYKLKLSRRLALFHMMN